MITRGLPGEGPLRIGSVALPAGMRIVSGYGTSQPVAWATIQPVPEPDKIWAALSAAHPQTGLVPFLLEGMAADPGNTQRPWDEGEFEDPTDIAELDRLDAQALLESWWNSQLRPLAEGQDEDPPTFSCGCRSAAGSPAWPPPRPCLGTPGNSVSRWPGRGDRPGSG
jgi:hypothetical protein